MSKATTVALADRLACHQAATATLEHFYDEAINALAADRLRAILHEVIQIDLVQDQAVYALPSDAVILQHVSVGTRTVTDIETATQAQQAFGSGWAQLKGEPTAYLRHTRSRQEIQLIPAPQVSTTFRFPTYASPFGLDFRPDALNLIYTTTKDTRMPPWVDLPLALLILGKEFSRDTNHRDIEFAQTATELGSFLLEALTR